MTIDVGNAQHTGSREEQQDAFGFSDLGDRRRVAHAGVLAVLSDGMGGLGYGSQMAQAAVRSFLEAYARKSQDEPIPVALARCLCEANHVVFELAKSLGAERAAGATIVAAVIHHTTLYWVSAGDSRAYLIRDERVHRLTVDHNWGEDVARGMARADGHGPGPDTPAATLTSFLGLPSDPRMDGNIRAYPLASGDTVLLASDGLHQAVSEEEIGHTLRGNARQACEVLVGAAVQRAIPDQDNVTVMAMTIPRPAVSGVALDRATRRNYWWQPLCRPAVALVLVAADLLLFAALVYLRAK